SRACRGLGLSGTASSTGAAAGAAGSFGESFTRGASRSRGRVVHQGGSFTRGRSQAHRLGDDRLHDLAGAAVDPVDAVVSVQAGDRVLVHVPVAAVQLQAAVDDAGGDLGAEQLGGGGVGGGQL